LSSLAEVGISTVKGYGPSSSDDIQWTSLYHFIIFLLEHVQNAKKLNLQVKKILTIWR
jgi:hypothetical protein